MASLDAGAAQERGPAASNGCPVRRLLFKPQTLILITAAVVFGVAAPAAEAASTAQPRTGAAAGYAGTHFGDGNLHIHALKPEAMSREEFSRQNHLVEEDLFALVQSYGGSISAEHGVGLLKKDHLGLSKSPEEIAIMKAIKRILDPEELLNPGKIFDL